MGTRLKNGRARYRGSVHGRVLFRAFRPELEINKFLIHWAPKALPPGFESGTVLRSSDQDKDVWSCMSTSGMSPLCAA
jgi:hypothetical protein